MKRTEERLPIERYERDRRKEVRPSIQEIKKAQRLRLIQAADQHDTLSLYDLMEFIDAESGESEKCTNQGFGLKEVRRRRNSLIETKTLRSLSLQLGLSSMILAGDWMINRKREIPESMAVIPFADLMEKIGLFRREHDPISALYKLIALDLGCGNGEFIDELRSELTGSHNFEWEIFGYADKIYFTLNGFLINLLNDEYTEDKALSEFIDIVSTLILRKINETSHNFGKKSSNDERLLNLTENLEIIRQILPNLNDYIELKGRKKLHVDIEFLSDVEREITPDTVQLIEEYFDSPGKFINKYFRSVLKDLTPREKLRIEKINEEIKNILENEKPITMVGIIEPIEETEDKKKIRELTQEKEWILSNIPSLAQYISLFPHNVILGKFDTFGTIFKEGSVNFGWSFRSTSHLDDNAYAETIEAAAISLAPGGVFLDDGKRESWTRFERISPLKTLQTKLGREYKIKVICTSQKANAVLIERGIVRDDGILVFFSDQYGNEILSEGANLINPGWLELEMPILSTRNRIISKIRDIIVPKSPNGLKSRMDFKDVHPVIENEISMAFNGVDFIDTDLISISDKIAEEVIEVLCNDSEITIKEKLKARAVPVGGDEAAIQTFPLNVAYGRTSYPVINDQRNIPVSLLPRNFEAPTLENLSHKVGDLFNSLNKLRKWIGTQPIEIVEFDDCFTNSLLEKTLHQILFENCFIHKVDFEELVKVRNISLYDRNFPDLCESNSPLLILGGSEANASEEAGECFSDNVCNPLLRHIQEGVLKRILAICFGSQAMLQAYGKIKEIPIITVPGALQFGAFPAVFSGTQTNILQELSDGIYSVGMTRGWYSDTLGKRPSDLIPIAYEADVQNGRLMPALNLPPLGFSIFNGEIIAIQFHPELPLSGEDAIDKPVEWMYRNERLLKRKYDLPLTENGRIDFESYFKPLGREKKGIAPWIKRDIGPVFLLNTLLKHAKECLKYSPT